MSGRIYSSSSLPRSSVYSSYTSPSSPLSGSTTHRVESVTRSTVRSTDSSLGGPGGTRSHSSTLETSTRDDGYGPRTSTFSSERSYGGPGGAGYFSTASYKSPYAGNSFRHMSYK